MTEARIEQRTLQELDQQVNYYYDLQQEQDRIKQSLEIAKATILESFKYLGMRQFQSLESNLVARVDIRVTERISAKEAKELLDADTYSKLTKESISVIFSVGKGKEKE